MPKKEKAEEPSSAIDKIDRTIHSPARLKILAILSIVEKGDFTFLMNQSGLSRGNLSSHLGVLEEAGYILVEKLFIEKIPRTLVKISPQGTKAIKAYEQNMRNVLEALMGD